MGSCRGSGWGRFWAAKLPGRLPTSSLSYMVIHSLGTASLASLTLVRPAEDQDGAFVPKLGQLNLETPA